MRTRKVLLVALPAKPHATLIAPGKKPPLRAGGDTKLVSFINFPFKHKELKSTYFIPRHCLLPFLKLTRYCSSKQLNFESLSHWSSRNFIRSGNIFSLIRIK